MSRLTVRLASVATLALAALPALAIPASAMAAPATVKVSDLNLTSDESMSEFDRRSDAAGRRFCRGERTLQEQAACRRGVRLELNEKAAQLRQAQSARQGSTFAAR